MVMEEGRACTFTVSFTGAGFRVTVMSRTELTMTATSACASAKPGAFTVT